jgi:hypothetical protein
VKIDSNKIKNKKGLIDVNSPFVFTAGNAFPLTKSRVTGRVPTGKPTVEEAFPVLEANLEAHDNSRPSCGQDAKQEEADAVEHLSV